MSSSRDVGAAFILIGFLAQFLPWVLVPRGTYIYHYFASVPFLCMAGAFVLNLLTERYPRTGRIVTVILLAVCAGLFVALYPYASGITVSEEWLDAMKSILRVYH